VNKKQFWAKNERVYLEKIEETNKIANARFFYKMKAGETYYYYNVLDLKIKIN
jgi:hypothetical protein